MSGPPSMLAKYLLGLWPPDLTAKDSLLATSAFMTFDSSSALWGTKTQDGFR